MSFDADTSKEFIMAWILSFSLLLSATCAAFSAPVMVRNETSFTLGHIYVEKSTLDGMMDIMRDIIKEELGVARTSIENLMSTRIGELTKYAAAQAKEMDDLEEYVEALREILEEKLDENVKKITCAIINGSLAQRNASTWMQENFRNQQQLLDQVIDDLGSLRKQENITKQSHQLLDRILDRLDTDECGSAPCMHRGICHDRVGGYTCHCEQGYEGVNCEINIDECSSSPCLNNATCLDKVDGYYCACLPGYIGDTCEQDTDECASAPCMHGGICLDLVNGYTCLCEQGYEGINCETDIDECSSSPCLNSATCLDKVDGYYCECLPGYIGDTCEQDTDECASAPCMNGGICVDLVDDYTCLCAQGYEGINCEIGFRHCGMVSTPGVTRITNTTLVGQSSYYALCLRRDDGYWMVFQRRYNGSLDFYRDWEAYASGFGDVDGEHWLGLRHLHQLSTHYNLTLRVEMIPFEEPTTTSYAEYSSFSIGSEGDGFFLSVDGYSGDAGDSLTERHNGKQFSTPDRDDEDDCSVNRHGAWWYDGCGNSSLNGRYTSNITLVNKWFQHNFWRSLNETRRYALKATTMMVRIV